MWALIWLHGDENEFCANRPRECADSALLALSTRLCRSNRGPSSGSNLGTVRRAMVPPPDPTDALVTVDAPRARRSPRRRWTGALGCIGLVTLVAIAVTMTLAWWSDDADDAAPTSERRWVMVERFDVEPSALTPVFEVRTGDGRARFAGDDGCRDVVVELMLDASTVRAVAGGATPTCDIATATPLSLHVDDEIAIDGDRLTIRRDEAPIAVFAAADSLPVATEDDIVGTWLLDELRTIEFRRDRFGDRTELVYESTRRCVGDDPSPEWQLDDGELRVVTELATTAEGCPSGFGGPADTERDLAVELGLRRLLSTGALAYVAAGRPILVGADAAVTLRPRPEPVETSAPINAAAGTAFGIAPGVGVSADDVVAAVTPELGGPTYDTGWLDVPSGGLVPCPDTDDEYRELWWDDLSFTLWRRGGRTFLSAWALGPPPESTAMFDVPPFDRPDATSSGLQTESGLGIGDDADRLAGANVRRTDISSGDPGEPTIEMIIVASTDGGSTFTAVDGRIERIEATAFTCSG